MDAFIKSSGNSPTTMGRQHKLLGQKCAEWQPRLKVADQDAPGDL